MMDCMSSISTTTMQSSSGSDSKAGALALLLTVDIFEKASVTREGVMWSESVFSRSGLADASVAQNEKTLLSFPSLRFYGVNS
jgi:hypothetical protein